VRRGKTVVSRRPQQVSTEDRAEASRVILAEKEAEQNGEEGEMGAPSSEK